MKTLRDVVLIVCAILVFGDGVSQASGPLAEQPEYKPGDYWVFTVGSSAQDEGGQEAAKSGEIRLEFVSKENDIYVFLVNGVRMEKWDKCLTRKTGKTGGYPGVVLEFPLKAGKHWKREYTAGSAADMKPMIAQYSVEVYGGVDMPTGKFRAYKIEAQTMPAKGKKISGTATYWYSPEAKMIINAFGGFLKEYRVQ